MAPPRGFPQILASLRACVEDEGSFVVQISKCLPVGQEAPFWVAPDSIRPLGRRRTDRRVQLSTSPGCVAPRKSEIHVSIARLYSLDLSDTQTCLRTTFMRAVKRPASGSTIPRSISNAQQLILPANCFQPSLAWMTTPRLTD